LPTNPLCLSSRTFHHTPASIAFSFSSCSNILAPKENRKDQEKKKKKKKEGRYGGVIPPKKKNKKK
jgi:hypothetical protein